MTLRHFLSIFTLIIFFSSCADQLNISNPSNTTDVAKYPSPLITSVLINSNSISFQIQSKIIESDFLGYIVYKSLTPITTDPDDINKFGSLQAIPSFYSYIPVENKNSQIKATLISNLISHQGYYIGVSCFGSNDDYRNVENDYNERYKKKRDHKGWLQSEILTLDKFYCPAYKVITLSNYLGGSEFSALSYTSTALEEAVASTSESSISNVLYCKYTNLNNSLFPFFKTGTTSGGIMNMGYKNQLEEKLDIPTFGYEGKNGVGWPIYLNHVYALKNGNFYAKLKVLSIQTNAFFKVSFEIYYSTIENNSAF